MTTRCMANVLISIASICLVSQFASAQGCETSLSDFSDPIQGHDTIHVRGFGGYPSSRLTASIDETGAVAYQEDGQCLVRKAGAVEPVRFQELLIELREALEDVRSQAERPNPSSLNEISELIRAGRIEPYCMSGWDGYDIEISSFVAGEREVHSCVTGALREFGHLVLQTIIDAAEADVGN